MNGFSPKQTLWHFSQPVVFRPIHAVGNLGETLVSSALPGIFTCCKEIIIVVKRFLLFLNRHRHGRGRFWSCCRPIIRHRRSCSQIIRHGGSCPPIGRRCSPIISSRRGCRKLFPRILKCCLQTVIRERGCGLSSCLTFVLPLNCQCLQGTIRTGLYG